MNPSMTAQVQPAAIAAPLSTTSGHVMMDSHKDDRNGTNPAQRRLRQPLNLVSTLLGNCLCDPFPFGESRGMSASTQFVTLHGVQFIGLGAVMDELTPRERVYDTLEQLTTRTDRLISVGYILDAPESVDRHHSHTYNRSDQPSSRKVTETIPLDVWNKNFPTDSSMSKEVLRMISFIRTKEINFLIEDLSKQLNAQKSFPQRGNNKYMAGITAHNLGVLHVLSGRDEDAEPYFRQAIALKEASFGQSHPEVALSWGELGIQRFAHGEFEEALCAFQEAHAMQSMQGSDICHPNMAMFLNNMACCEFQMGNHRKALDALLEARDIQQKAVGSSAQADLDLLHVAVVICNCGYLNLALKNYDEARSLLEEALIIQQSVLGDSHRAIRDTLSNIEFANAFHS